MKKLSDLKAVLGVVALALGGLASTPATAQATRTWVSGVGDDANPCSRTAPCRTFAGAISKTAAGGEISVLDPGGFGAVTITKSITIDGGGIVGSILAANTNGIIVNGANVVVNLRNLAINGGGTTTGNGIRIIQAGTVTIDNVSITGHVGTGTNGRGIAIETSTAIVRVSIVNSHIANMGNHGIHSNPSAGLVFLAIDDVDISDGAASAIHLVQNTSATISSSLLTGNFNGAGLTNERASNVATISNSVLTNNSIGVSNGGPGQAAVTLLYGNFISRNTSQGLLIGGGGISSFGNNAIRGNAGNETPTPPSLGLQ
ncbi:right-handed parallel beta-helix repeat-containing protein [Sphingosinicella sp.]|uniref:right-handed parallel beta-helix repeat-containing protein n=1 Tax=Sphingosinicella sp. TaxID=1917971 RepID=UPI004037916D